MLDPLSASQPTAPPPSPSKPRRRILQPASSPNSYILEADYSSLSDFMACARMGENSMIYGRTPDREPIATRYGTLFHHCEELRLRHGLSDSVRQRQRELISEHFLRHPSPPDEFRTETQMLETLARYEKAYALDGWPEKVLRIDGEPFIERPYKLPLCTIPVRTEVPYSPSLLVVGQDLDDSPSFYISSLHIVLTGKMDVALDDSSFLWIVDHKTSSRGGKEFEEQFRTSLQTRGYAWAAWKVLSRRPAGLILNGVIGRKPTLKGYSIELIRRPYFYDEWSLIEYEHNMRAIAQDFVAALVSGYFPQTGALSFKSHCPGCAYFENCTLPPHQRAADLASNVYRDITWDPTDPSAE